MKSSFFQAAVVSILLYVCTTWTLTKWLEKKLDGNYTRMLRAILNKSWRQHPTRHQLYGHLPPITKTIHGHCWRSKDELVSDVILWTPTYGQAKAGWPARTYIQQLCEDTGCNPEDLLEAMNNREKWREMVRDIHAGGTTRWLWWYIYWQHFFVNTNFVEYNRYFLSTYILVDPFILLLWSYSIQCELIDISFIIVYFLSTFCLTLGHHQGRMYYKSDVTFVCTLLLSKKSIWAVAVCSIYFKIVL